MNRMTKIGLAATALAATAAITPVITATAANASPATGCVSRADFAKVKHGMTMDRVARIMGTNGKQTWYYDGTYIPDEQDREYKTCSRWSMAEVDFQRPAHGGTWKVHSKTAYWM